MCSHKTHLVELTPGQVRQALDSFLANMEQAFPDPDERLDVLERMATTQERLTIKHNLMGLVPDCLEVSWLLANDAPWTIKSSMHQFLAGTVKVQVTDKALHKRFLDWREN